MEQKFLKKIEKTDTCWNWKGRLDIGGYGRFCQGDGHWTKAHRTSYKIYKGSIADGLIVRHICNNRKCVNPDHLIAGTQKENVADMFASNRQSNRKGSANGKSKFIELDILEIRQWYEFGYSLTDIGKAFDSNQPQISNIVHRKSWKHI